jgi:hypothetical protein
MIKYTEVVISLGLHSGFAGKGDGSATPSKLYVLNRRIE